MTATPAERFRRRRPRPLLGLLTASPMLAATPAAAQNIEDVIVRPGEILGSLVQSTMTVAGDEIATSGSFRDSDELVDSKIRVQRLQLHHDLPQASSGPLAPWVWRGVASYTDFRATYRYSAELYGMREKFDARLLAIGVNGTRGWGDHLFGRLGLSVNVGRFRDTTDFGTMPEAAQVYALLNKAYINTTVKFASVTARVGAGWRQPPTRSGRWHGSIEASWLPIYTRTIDVETDSQRFSKASSSLYLRAGLEWLSSLTLYDRSITFAPSYSRRQYLDAIRPLGGAALNEVSLDILLGATYRHRMLGGLGIGASWVRSGPWSGWRIELKGLFG